MSADSPLQRLILELDEVQALTPEAFAQRLAPLSVFINTHGVDVEADRKTAARMRKAYSANTQRVWRSNWRAWTAYTDARDIAPIPAGVDTLEAFIDHCIDRGLKRATIEQYLYTLGLAHRLAGLPDPMQSNEGKLVLKAMRGHNKLRKAQRQAPALRQDDIRELLAPMSETNPRDLRDRALILVVYETLMRRSELVTRDFEHLAYTRDLGWRINVDRSKTNREGEDDWRPISDYTHQQLQKWLDVAKITDGPLFRSIPPRWSGSTPLLNPLTGQDVARILQRRADKSETPLKKFTGHSPRVGQAVDLCVSGYTDLQIQHAGGWKTNAMVARYTKGYRNNQSAVLDRLKSNPWAASHTPEIQKSEPTEEDPS